MCFQNWMLDLHWDGPDIEVGVLTQERSWLVLVCVSVSLHGRQVLLACQLHGERMSTISLHLPLVQPVLDISGLIIAGAFPQALARSPSTYSGWDGRSSWRRSSDSSSVALSTCRLPPTNARVHPHSHTGSPVGVQSQGTRTRYTHKQTHSRQQVSPKACSLQLQGGYNI